MNRLHAATSLLLSVGVATAVDPFTVVIIPDTQRYPQVIADGGPDLFTMKTQWIRDNIAAENIAFVTHVGDVIQDSSSLWPYADGAMSLLDGQVPYSVTFGNHDGGAPNVFAAPRYNSYPWYQGSSADSLAHAQTFTEAGITFLHLNLPHNPNNTHLTWAQGVINANPGKPTMITTHGYMADNSSGRSSNGENIWNTLIAPNPQVFLTANGHDWVSRHEIDTTSNGKKVLQIQANWQQIINGGNGLMQLVTFDPDKSEIRVKTYSPLLDLNHTDYSGEFSVSATFGPNSVDIGSETGPQQSRWTGNSDSNWQTAGNWGGTAPQPGDLLFFQGVTRKISQNNFPPNTSFAGIVFEPGRFSNGYEFSGNSLTLAGDIVNMGGYGPNIAGSGPIIDLDLTLVGDRQINTGDWDLTVKGVIRGAGSLTKTHGRDYLRGSYDGGVNIGDLYLTNINTYTGNTRVTGGALILNNATESNLIPSSPNIEVFFNSVLKVSDLQNGTLTLSAGQTLRGDGKVLGTTHLASHSSLAPGHDGIGRFRQIGNLSATSGSSIDLEVAGAPADDHDQVVVTGSLTLGSATLNLTTQAGYSPQVGDSLLLIENDGTESVVGTFVSGTGSTLPVNTPLPEGAVVTTDFVGTGLTAAISYQGGSGNDVTLTVLPPAGPPVFTHDPIIRSGAQIGIPYRDTIARSALDGDNDPLVYRKLSGPDWLQVGPGGTLSGTPITGTGDTGVNVFTVRVDDPHGNSDSAMLAIEVATQKLVGQWDFDDPNDLTKATIGSDLTLVGTHQAVAGPSVSNGAAFIGTGSHYLANHGVAPNGGGNNVNEYTLVMDVSYPTSSTGTWMSFLQTSPANNNDGDCFIRNSNATIGVAATGYSSYSLPANTWARIVVAADNGSSYRIYADGNLIINGSVQAVDGRFSLASTLLFFADNNGEDNPIRVSSLRFYNSTLSDQEIAELSNATTPDSDNDGLSDSADSDDDNDGIPDDWELANGLNPLLADSQLDSDGDGFDNLSEFLAATNPQDAGSQLGLSITINGGEISLSFPSSADRYYTLQASNNLEEDSWSDFALPTLGTGLVMMSQRALATIEKQFYRLHTELP